MEVNHVHGTEVGNSPENLEVVTSAQNIEHSYEVLGNKPAHGENHPHARLTEQKAAEIVAMLDRGMRICEVVHSTGTPRHIVTRIRDKRAWIHVWQAHEKSRKIDSCGSI